ncbi:MAG: hypothetical protein NVS9B15_20580 [Acidobacteriaceae bacterium]
MKIALCVCVASVLLCGTSVAREQKISRSSLPPAVQKTAAAQSQGAKVLGYAKEVEGGRTTYEVQMSINGHSKDVSIDETGHVAEVEEQVELHELPEAVRPSLQPTAGKGQIKKIESLTKSDKIVAYEAQIVASGKHHEIQVGPDGKALSHPE